jgi:type IV secretion system protein VirB10
MKSKPVKPQTPELEDEDSVDVEATGPAIAAAKKSKIAIIAASTILTVMVFYFFFFKGDDVPTENLELVEAPKPSNIAPSESGKSLFEFEENKQKEEVDVLAKPAVPDVPTLPELPEDAVMPDALTLNDPNANKDLQKQPLPNQPLLPSQELPFGTPGQPSDPTKVGDPAQTALEEKKPVNPRYAPIIVFSGGEGATTARGVGYEDNILRLKKNPLEELQETQAGVTATYISDRTHTIAQGKLLTAVLETAINTEIPGAVRGIVSRDVYGEAGTQVLIPKGSRLYGSYTSEIKRGQGRVEISWTRLIRPDGVDLAISFNASDQFGRSGIPGEVDNKYSSIVANSLLTSVIAVAGAAAAQSLVTDASTTTTTNPAQGTTTTTGNATNQAINNVTSTIVDTVGQIINGALDLTPIIRVPQGTRITVIVNSDIKVPFINGR